MANDDQAVVSTDVPDFSDIDMTKVQTVQPLLFVLGNPQADHMSGESTFDEHGHILAFNNDLVSGNGRDLQTIFIRQGDYQSFSYPMYFYDGVTGRPADLTGGLVLTFEGQSKDGPWFRTGDNFDVTQAEKGLITWSPTAKVSQYAGYFKYAHIIIENEKRTQRIATLDFSICVIPTDVPIPAQLSPVQDEYLKVLNHTFLIEQTANSQIIYTRNFVETLAQTMISNANTQVGQSITDSQTKLNAQLSSEKKTVDEFINNSQTKVNAQVTNGQKQIDDMITSKTDEINQLNAKIKDWQTTIDALDSGVETLTDKETKYEKELNAQIASWATQVDGKNLITKDQMVSVVQQTLLQLADDGKITFDDSIKDNDLKAKIEKLAGTEEE